MYSQPLGFSRVAFEKSVPDVAILPVKSVFADRKLLEARLVRWLPIQTALLAAHRQYPVRVYQIAAAVAFQLRRINRNSIEGLWQEVFPLILICDGSQHLIHDLAIVGVHHYDRAVALFAMNQQLSAESLVGSAVAEVGRIAPLLEKETEPDLIFHRSDHPRDRLLREHLVRFTSQ